MFGFSCFPLFKRCCFKPGLIILNAWYGKFVTDNSRRHERAKVIDVTVPLQCLVKDSKLILTEATKVRRAPLQTHDATVLPDLPARLSDGGSSFQSGLPGFYDPCVGEEKSLKVLYQFRGVMHQVVSGDTEPLRIPKQCKPGLSHSGVLGEENPPACICAVTKLVVVVVVVSQHAAHRIDADT